MKLLSVTYKMSSYHRQRNCKFEGRKIKEEEKKRQAAFGLDADSEQLQTQAVTVHFLQMYHQVCCKNSTSSCKCCRPRRGDAAAGAGQHPLAPSALPGPAKGPRQPPRRLARAKHPTWQHVQVHQLLAAMRTPAEAAAPRAVPTRGAAKSGKERGRLFVPVSESYPQPSEYVCQTLI